MMLRHNTVVAVVDGESVALFRNTGDEAAIELSPLAAPALHLNGHGSGGRHRSSTANPDNRLQEEDGHAAAVAHWLNREAAGNGISDLLVIAPARTLGELRRHYDPHLRTRLVAEISKELVGRPASEIEAAISAHW